MLEEKNRESLNDSISTLLKLIPNELKLKNLSWIGSIDYEEKLEANILRLLKHADAYRLYTSEVFELRVILLRLYISNLRYSSIKECIGDIERDIELYKFDSEEGLISKIAFYYIAAIYYDYEYSNFLKSKELFNKAEWLLQNVKQDHNLIHATYIMQGSTYIWGGNVKKARYYIDKYKENANKQYNISWEIKSLGDFIEAKVLMEEERYKEALVKIKNSALGYEKERDVSKVDTVPIKILYSEILRKMQMEKEANSIINNTYDEVTGIVSDKSELLSRILLENAAVNIAIRKYDEAMVYIDKAIKIINFIHEEAGQQSYKEYDDNLAFGHELKGDFLSFQKHYTEALDFYIKSYNIYKNRYEGVYEMDNLKILILKIIKSAIRAGEMFLAKGYINVYEEYYEKSIE